MAHFENAAGAVEYALFELKDVRRSQLHLRFKILRGRENTQREDLMKLYVPRLVNALEVSNLDNYMLELCIWSRDEKVLQQMNRMKQKLKNTNLVHVEEKMNSNAYEFDTKRLIISNKECRINGYSRRWILQRE